MLPKLTFPVRVFCAVLMAYALLAAQVAGAQPAPRAWTPPETLTPAAQQSKLPQIAMDGAGNALVTWIAEGGGLRQAQAVQIASTGSWSPLVKLYSPATSAAVPFEASDVAVNASGRGAAVWVRAIGTAPSDQIAQAAVFTGTSWRAAVNLMPASAPGLRSPRVGVDSDGNAVAVWVQSMAGVAVVRASRYAVGAAWSMPVTISSSGEAVDEGVVLGVDDAGNAMAVWTGSPGGVRTLRAVRYTDATGTWSAPADVAPAGRAPSVVRLAVDRAGTSAFVAYRGFDGARDVARVARLDMSSGTWSAPVDVSTAQQAVVDVDIAVSEAGHGIVIWNLLDGTVQTARYNGSWGGPSDRATGAPTREVSIDTDAAGNAVATWARLDGAVYRAQASMFTVGTGLWTTPDTVSDTAENAVAPRARLHTDGTAVVVWQANSDTAYVRASRYVLTSAPRLSPAVVNGSDVTLTWNSGTGTPPSSYTVVASATAGGAPIAQIQQGLQTSATVFARSGGYYVRVLATVNGVRVGSNEIFVIVGAGPVPMAPTDLTAMVNGNTVTLTWSPPLNESVAPVRTYNVAVGTVQGSSNLTLFPTGSAQTTYVATAVPNGSYWLRVYAESTGGLGPASNDVRVIVGPPPPGAPVLSGGATGPGAVLLQWSAAPAPGAPVTEYQLQAGYQPGQSNATVFNLPLSALSYGATAIPPGTYYVRVVALSSAGPGEASNEVIVTIP